MGKKKLKVKNEALLAHIEVIELQNKELEREVQLLRTQTADKDIFLGSAMLHTNFLEFMFQANNAHDDLYYLIQYRNKELLDTSSSLVERYENMSIFLRNLSNTYSDIRGVSKYTMQLDLKEVAK